LLVDSIILGVLLGGFYAALSVGLTVSFGLVKIVNVAHPTFILVASYIIFSLNSMTAADPIVIGLLLTIPFFALGVALFLAYDRLFSGRSKGDQELIGLVFFFGVLVVLEIVLLRIFGVTERGITTSYSTSSTILFGVLLPDKFLFALIAGVIMIVALHLFFTRTFTGRAVRAVAEDEIAVMLMGGRPTRVKALATGLSMATAAVAGGLLIMVQPIYPSLDIQLVGLTFAVVILGGRRSLLGTLIASMFLGIATSVTATLLNVGLSLGVAYVILLATLALRPEGLFKR